MAVCRESVVKEIRTGNGLVLRTSREYATKEGRDSAMRYFRGLGLNAYTWRKKNGGTPWGFTAVHPAFAKFLNARNTLTDLGKS